MLTETGHRFLPHARELLSAADATLAVAVSLAAETAKVAEPAA